MLPERIGLLTKSVHVFLTLSVCLLLPITVHARSIIENPATPGFPSDPAFAGSFTIPLNETLPAESGDQSFTITVGGVQFFFQTASPNGLFRCSDSPQGRTPPCFLLSTDSPTVITINPPVAAFGIINDNAECVPEATFVGSLGTETGLGSFGGNPPLFLGAADIGVISTVALSDTCVAFAAWSEIRFVPAGGVPSATADVAVNKRSSASAIRAGARLDYSVNVANNGRDTAENVVVVDFLPPKVTVRAASAGATLDPPLAPTTATWSLGNLPSSANSPLRALVTTPPFDSIELSSQETWSCEDTLLNIAAAGTSTVDPNLRNNVAFTATRFDKASRANQPEICDNGIDDNCDGIVDCNDPTCTSVCNPVIAPAPGVGGGGDGGSGGGSGSCTDFFGVSFPPSCCDTGFEICGTAFDPNFKESDPPTNVFGHGYAQAGQTITYTLHYENVGGADAHNVSILDPLHPDLDETTLVINNGGTYDSPTRVILWQDPLPLPPHEPRSVSFSVNIRLDKQPGTRVRDRATVVFPDASASPRTDTNFVEHTILDPRFPVVTDLSVIACAKDDPHRRDGHHPDPHKWRVKLVNKGFGFAYNVTAEVVNPPVSVRVTNPLVHFVHPSDLNPDALATVMPLSTSTSEDAVTITAVGEHHEWKDHSAEEQDDDDHREGHRDPCGALTWRIRYTASNGEMLSKDILPSIARLCPCAGPAEGGKWKNHGAYESCVAEAVEIFGQARLITRGQGRATLEAAERSLCGGQHTSSVERGQAEAEGRER